MTITLDLISLCDSSVKSLRIPEKISGYNNNILAYFATSVKEGKTPQKIRQENKHGIFARLCTTELVKTILHIL